MTRSAVEYFNMCLKESCFPDCWKVSTAVYAFKNPGERSTEKNYDVASFLPIVYKPFKTSN